MYTQYRAENTFDFSQYPVDMSLFLMSPHWSLTAIGVPSNVSSVEYHPTAIAQYALAHWNQYLATNDESHRNMFLAQAQWLVEHEARIGNDAGGWPISSPHPDVHREGLWLSALTQGNALSALVRAYQLTQEEVFLEVACRVVRTFEKDILDGGISTPIGKGGVFFEEFAVYPARHTLSGFMFALFGLYDYVALTDDAQVKKLIQRSLSTMHVLLDEFDLGFWTRTDLLHRCLSSSAHLALQTMLLEVLVVYSGCEHCSMLASRWKSYQCRLGSRLRYLITSHCTSFGSMLLNRMRSIFFPKTQISPILRVCVPITAFPITGGMRTVLAKVVQVTEDIWQLEYLTQHVGPHPAGFIIHRFGSRKMSPWQFPTVWLYVLAGFWKLISLLRHGAGYHVILLQDGIFTAAFAALAARMAGVRSVCIDHGNLSLLKSRNYRAERIRALATRKWHKRLLALLLYKWYWPSLYLMAWFGARFVDQYFIPGVTGDGVEETCKRLGVHPCRITRFANMIDIERHIIPDAMSRVGIREKHGIAANAIVIAIVCRLAPEKGLEIALEAISQALSILSPNLSSRVRVIIAGDGSLRRQIEEDICLCGLSQTCLLWGEASTDEVISLLGLSDIFLFTSWRAAGYPLAILEAMASGCAVIASAQPLAANEYILAEGRGITVPVGDADQTARALVRLVNDPELCRQMGDLARNYVAVQHNATMFKRALLRVTFWSGLDEFLNVERA